MRYIHYLPGGGLGDIYREAYFNNALGILKRWKLENQDAHLKILLMSHNPASVQLLEGHSWIDELTQVRFPLERTWEWEAAYGIYSGEFENRMELRFVLPERRSLYSANFSSHRPRHKAVTTIPNVGMAWTRPPTSLDETFILAHLSPALVHPFAGQEERCFSPALRSFVNDALRDHSVIGADYARQSHGAEVGGVTLHAQGLVRAVEHSRFVVATESSVYYIASMLGIPTLCFYGRGTALDKFLNRNDRSWDWYFNLEDPKSLFVPLYDWEARRQQILTWIEERTHE